MNVERERCTYSINPEDIIVSIGGDWLRFAQENEAPDLIQEQVVGKPLWSFIFGTEVQRIYQELFRSLRLQRTERIIPFRCDSPTIVRHMELTIRSAGTGFLDFEGKLLRQEERNSVNALSRDSRRSKESIPICSVCRRLQWREEWIDIEAMIVRRRLLNNDLVPQLVETVCSECLNMLAK